MLRIVLASLLPLLVVLEDPCPQIDPAPAATTGRIDGHVVDAEGHPFAFADVALKPEAGSTYGDATLTEMDGSFQFPSVPVGSYKLSSFADGFKPRETIVNISVQPGSTQGFTITMIPIAGQVCTLMVQARQQDIVDIRKTDTSRSLNGQFISKVPLQNRRIQDIVSIFPGVSRPGSADSTDISVGGGQAAQIGYRLDSMNTRDPVNGGAVLDVPSAAISSFKPIAGGYNAEYGEQSSGIAEIVARPSPPIAQLAQVEAANREAYAHHADNSFRRSLDEPLSTFSVDVDTASYSNVRRILRGGELPPPDAVRIEELINYFRYDDPAPSGDLPFAVRTEMASCPWAPAHRLMRIGVSTASMDDGAMPPRSLVFLIDVSGSMGQPDKLPLVKASLRLLVDRLRPEDEVALVVYAGAAGLVLPLTNASERATILGAIDRLESGGSTNGGDGIRLAYKLAEQATHDGAISRVILATDGDFNVGTTSEGELVRLIEEEREKKVFLTVLGYGTGNLQDSTMESLADHGNGNYAYVDCIEEARKVLDREASATLVTVAKDVKIQVEFNPATVASWRLVGYEDRLLAARDFDDDRKDAGEIGAGHHVTALYEILPVSPWPPVDPEAPLRYRKAAPLSDVATSGETALVRIRYKPPTGDTSKLFEKTVVDGGADIASASDSMRFASAVASFGMLLRGTDGVATTWPQVIALARSSTGADPDGLRAQFVTLAEKAQVIAPSARVGE